MLRVDLGQLEREGSVVVEGAIGADHSLWDGSGVALGGPVDVVLRVTMSGTGEVVARGRMQGTLQQQCRRCLKEVKSGFAHELTLVFVSDPDTEEDDGGAYPLDLSGRELDLSSAVREEMMLAYDPYVVCDPGCLGLCPRCGQDLNERPCTCEEDETDPRWEALRKLKSE